MNIRQGKITDLDEIAAVESMCFPNSEAASVKSFEQRLRVFPDSFLIAEEDGRIIGFVNGCVTDNRVICDEMFADTGCHKPEGDFQAIFGLAVIPECRGKGVAGELMKSMIELTGQRGKKGLILTCKEHLLEYYRSFGFQSLGVSGSTHGGAVWYDMIMEF